MKHILIYLIRAYQLALSSLLGPRCRFYPTCSAYAVEAIERHGALRGSVLAARRVGKCHPFHPGGVDLVPAPGALPKGLPGTVAGTVAGTVPGTVPGTAPVGES